MAAWFEHTTFPAADPRAQELAVLLGKAYDEIRRIRHVGSTAGVNLDDWHAQDGFGPAWRSMLEIASLQGRLPALLQVVLADEGVSAFHPELTELMNRPGEVVTIEAATHVTQADVVDLHSVAVLLRLTEDEERHLRESVPAAFAAQLPGFGASASSRLFGTLQILNRIAGRTEGEPPLVSWMRSLGAIRAGHPELDRLASVFRKLGIQLPAVDVTGPSSTDAKASPGPKPVVGSPRRTRAPSRAGTAPRSISRPEKGLPEAPRFPAAPPVRLEVFHRAASEASLTDRLFHLLTGDQMAAFRDLHVPVLVFDDAPADSVSPRGRPVSRRLSLVLLDDELDRARAEFLPALSARAAATSDEKIVIACLDPRLQAAGAVDEWTSALRAAAGGTEPPRISIDSSSKEARFSSLEAGLLNTLCQWLPTSLDGGGDRSPSIRLCLADPRYRALISTIAAWMRHHGLPVRIHEGPGTALSEDDGEEPCVVILRTDAWANTAHGPETVVVAKQRRLPIVVVEDMVDGEGRSFPYLGNTPTMPLRLQTPSEPFVAERSAAIARLALSELLRMRLARHRLSPPEPLPAGVRPFFRPPELLDAGESRGSWLLYPDPPLATHEIGVLMNAGIRAVTPTQWRSLGGKP